MSAVISDDLDTSLTDAEGIVWRHGRGGVRVTLRNPPRDRNERVESFARAAAEHWAERQVEFLVRDNYAVRLHDGWAGTVGVTVTRNLARVKSVKRHAYSLSRREAEELEHELDEVLEHRAAT